MPTSSRSSATNLSTRAGCFVRASAADRAAEASPAAEQSGPGAGTRWLVDGETRLPVDPPTDATTVEVGMVENRFTLTPRTVAGPDLVLAGRNTGQEDHEMLVLRLDRGVRIDTLLTQPGPRLPPGVTFIGELTVAAGGQGDLVLVGLAPGSYILVCLLPDASGTPHLALGMKARLRVT